MEADSSNQREERERGFAFSNIAINWPNRAIAIKWKKNQQLALTAQHSSTHLS